MNNVSEFMTMEKRAGRSILRMNVVERVAQACQLSTNTVVRIRREAKNNEGNFSTPSKRYHVSRKKINPDSFDREAIRRTIHAFYERNEYPTLDSVLEQVKEKEIFRGGRSTLYKLLREMGFKYRQHENKRYIYEQPRIIQQRHSYLRTMRANRNSEHPRPTIFLDETWCNAHHGNTRMWVDSDGTGGFKHPTGKGKRLIILHAGGIAGWLSQTELIFKSKSNTGDYHNEMNATHFLEWFENKLCTHVPINSLIVLDNASYHNTEVEKIPTMKSRKSEMKEWLTKHGIDSDECDLKVDLMGKITQARPTKQFATDAIAEKFTHTVVRLPVAHPELNPIELAWSVIKGYVAKHNKKFTLTEVERLTREAMGMVTPTMWEKFCAHTEKVEEMYWKKDGLIEDVVEEIMLNVGDDEDDSDDEVEPDEDDLQLCECQDSSGPVEDNRLRDKQACSRKLQLEHPHPTSAMYTHEFLKSVVPLE